MKSLIFSKNYSWEELYDLGRDMEECFDSRYNKGITRELTDDDIVIVTVELVSSEKTDD